MMDIIDELTKNIHFLGKFGILPEVIFVMIFQYKRNTAFGGIRQTCFDALGGVIYPLPDGYPGSALPRKNPAVGTAQRTGHIDPVFLLVDFFCPEISIRMRKIGRTAHHGNLLPLLLCLPAKSTPVRP